MSEERDDNEGKFDQPPAFFPYQDEDETAERPDFGEPIEVQVEGVFAAESRGDLQRFVLLSDGLRKVPILIGAFEAAAITMCLDGVQPDRPLTHDLMKTALEKLQSGVLKIVIDDLWSTTYYAKVFLKTAREEIIIDARPSDAIALALRFESPIYVAEGILEQSSQS